MLRCLILDDESKSREVLKTLLENFCEDVEVVSMADTIETAMRELTDKKPDLVFLDISLKEGDSFQLLDKLEAIDFEIIFITAFDEYSIKALQFSDIPCLMKPIDIEELQDAVNLVKQQQVKNTGAAYELAGKILKSGFKLLPVLTGNEMLILEIANIEMIKRDVGSGCVITLNSGKQIHTKKEFESFEKLLQGKVFFKIHTDSLVNIKYIQTIKNSNVLLYNGEFYNLTSGQLKDLQKLLES